MTVGLAELVSYFLQRQMLEIIYGNARKMCEYSNVLEYGLIIRFDTT